MTTITGLPGLKTALLSIPDKLRKRALLNALRAAGRVVRDDAKASAPVMSLSAAQRAPYRTPGLLKKSISVRTSKIARRGGDVGVFVNVKPAKGAARGGKSKLDPFYWRWQEFGWAPATGPRGNAGKRARRKSAGSTKIKGVRFLSEAAKKLPQALNVFYEKIGPAIDKINKGMTP